MHKCGEFTHTCRGSRVPERDCLQAISPGRAKFTVQAGGSLVPLQMPRLILAD